MPSLQKTAMTQGLLKLVSLKWFQTAHSSYEGCYYKIVKLKEEIIFKIIVFILLGTKWHWHNSKRVTVIILSLWAPLDRNSHLIFLFSITVFVICYFWVQLDHSAASLAGSKRMLNCWQENLEWNSRSEQEVQPHDQPAPEPKKLKHFFGPATFYCVETICFPCGVVEAWAKFAKAESESNILVFMKKVYPTKGSHPTSRFNMWLRKRWKKMRRESQKMKKVKKKHESDI